MAVVLEQLVAVLLRKACPVIASGHRAGSAIRWPAAFVGRFQGQQIGELLDVVAVADAAVAQDVEVVTELTMIMVSTIIMMTTSLGLSVVAMATEIGGGFAGGSRMT